MARAVSCCLKRWPALTRLVEDGRYPIDNNPIEHAIRPVPIGTKHCLSAGSETSGRHAAAIMRLPATAKSNGREPHAGLSDVLERLPTTKDRGIDSLLPDRWSARARERITQSLTRWEGVTTGRLRGTCE